MKSVLNTDYNPKDPAQVDRLVKEIRRPYADLENLWKAFVTQTREKYRHGDVDPEQMGKDFVKFFEFSQERRMKKAGQLLDPLWVKISHKGDLDIGDWANTFLVQGTDILDESKNVAKKLTREVVVDSSLIEDVLGSFIRGKMKKKFIDMAAADTSGRSSKEIMNFYQKPEQLVLQS